MKKKFLIKGLKLRKKVLKSEKSDWLTEEEEEGVEQSLKDLKEGKGFQGTAKEVVKWLKK